MLLVVMKNVYINILCTLLFSLPFKSSVGFSGMKKEVMYIFTDRFRYTKLKAIKSYSMRETYLIRRNFRADKFSRIFAQKLNLREIARKLVLDIFTFVHKKDQR